MGAYALAGHATGSVELATVTRAELYSQARQLGVPGRSRMNKEELARAVRERGPHAVQARVLHRRSPLWATTPVFRALAWKSFRMIPPLATVMVSAAIGATTPMLLVDSSRQLGDVMRADVPAAYVQPAYAQPGPLAEAATASVHDAAASSRRAAPTIVLADASGNSTMGSASQPADKGTGTPPRDSGPAPSQPGAGDGDGPGGGSDDPGGGGDPGAGNGPGDAGGPVDGTGSDDPGEGDAEEGGKGKDNGKGVGNGKGKDGDKGNDKDKVEDDHEGKQKEKGEG
jgi:Rho termination factor, N-terminal domain